MSVEFETAQCAVSTTPPKTARPARSIEAVSSLRRSVRQRERQALQCWKAEQQRIALVARTGVTFDNGIVKTSKPASLGAQKRTLSASEFAASELAASELAAKEIAEWVQDFGSGMSMATLSSQCERARSGTELQLEKRGVKRKLDSVKDMSSVQLSDDEVSTSIGDKSPSRAMTSDSESPPASPLVVESPFPVRSNPQRSTTSPGEVCLAPSLRRSFRQQERRGREQLRGCVSPPRAPARREALPMRRGGEAPVPPATVKARLSAIERAIPQNLSDFIVFEDSEPALRSLQSTEVPRSTRRRMLDA